MLADLVVAIPAWALEAVDTLRHLDRDLYFSVHGATPPAVPVLYAARLLSAIGGGFALFLLPPAWLAARKKSEKTLESLLYQLLLAVLVTAAVVFLMKLAVGRTRPCYALHAGAWCTPPTDPSFPSGHAAGSMAVAVTLGRRSRAALPLLFAAIGVAWSRVVLGVHFPSDVLAGAALGAALAWVIDARWNRPRATFGNRPFSG
jgi:undecaprenyl-diphosphatase